MGSGFLSWYDLGVFVCLRVVPFTIMNGKPPDGFTAEWNADFKSYNDHGFRRVFTSAVASAVPTLEVDAVDDRAEDVATMAALIAAVSSVTPSALAPKSLTLIGFSPTDVSADATLAMNNRASAVNAVVV